MFLIESAGGGGYGDPRQRTGEARAHDREMGFVTRGAAVSAIRRKRALQ
jgi:N-methylhydantoinase B/oxoprolinase/acetone carboxylase alpha subunit